MPDISVLSDPTKLASLDPRHVLDSILAFPDQIQDAYEQVQTLVLPDTYAGFTSVFISGMGASGLGARIIESVYADELNLPFSHWHNYGLPAYVNQHTLVICSAYSGSTEEPISTAQACIDRGIPWIGIASGGPLLELAKTHQVPFYLINPRFNPSGQPRMALGYSLIGQLAILAKAGLYRLDAASIKPMVEHLKLLIAQNHPSVSAAQNPAKMLAQALFGRIPILIAANHLTGSAHVIKNQFNENAKTFSALFEIPELNHHFMEGLLHPQSNPDNLSLILFTSSLYPEKIDRRFALTLDVIQKNGLPVHTWPVSGDTELEQAFSLIQFGAFVVHYLSMLYNQNPAPIPWVDYFKAQLVK